MRHASWRTQKRDWHGKHDAKRNRSRKKSLSIPVFVLSFCLLGIGGWFFFFSHFFIIDIVDVSVEGDIDPAAVREVFFDEMEGRRLLIFPRSNVFFFDSGAARRALGNSFAVTDLKIRRQFPNHLSVTMTGKRFRALWFTQGILYELAPSGQVVKNVDRGIVQLPPEFRAVASSTASKPKEKKPQEHIAVIPLIADEKNQPAAIGQTVIPEEDLSFVTALPSALSDIGIRLSSLSLSQGAPDLTVTTAEGWRLRLSFHTPLDEQIHYLDTLLREAVKKKRKKLELVDVRFENKLFYTFKDGK